MPIRAVVIEVPSAVDGSWSVADLEAIAAVSAGDADLRIGTIGFGAQAQVDVDDAFHLDLDAIGVPPHDPRSLAMAAAAGACHLRELVVVAPSDSPLLSAAGATGCRSVVTHAAGAGSLVGLTESLERLRAAERAATNDVGVGPHPRPWPEDPRFDPTLLAHGDRRNVVDRFRYWSEAAIVAELAADRRPFHVAVENWQHDLNIGTVVRNANAFNAAGVHIIGNRRWNRRGAMATDRYLSVTHHADVDAFAAWAETTGLAVVGIDNIDGAVPIEQRSLPAAAVLVFGQEGPGLSTDMVRACSVVCEITQHGSTRSLNAGVASGIAMYAWSLLHGPGSVGGDQP